MSFENRRTDELVQIATSGGGFTLGAGNRPVEDLLLIARAAKAGGARVTLSGLGNRPTDDLVRLAEAGRGFITLE